ncbi:hypothetical protein [Nonomuraea glycinis]|uniref:hypothetical protein n=1 Tax=Nonomuraea glycinis TaxID=2047744 RepID=UPI0033BAA6E7
MKVPIRRSRTNSRSSWAIGARSTLVLGAGPLVDTVREEVAHAAAHAVRQESGPLAAEEFALTPLGAAVVRRG